MYGNRSFRAFWSTIIQGLRFYNVQTAFTYLFNAHSFGNIFSLVEKYNSTVTNLLQLQMKS